jgi:beta-mannosidase
VPANTSTIFVDESIEAILGTAKAEDVVIASTLTVGEKSYSNTNFFVRQRYLNLPKADIKVNVADVADGVEITLSTDNFARAVYLAVEDIESRFEDNFIDILPQSSRKIKVQTGLSAKEFSKQLKILHLQQTK